MSTWWSSLMIQLYQWFPIVTLWVLFQQHLVFSLFTYEENLKSRPIHNTGNTKWRRRLCTVDLHIKIAFSVDVNNVCNIKSASSKLVSTRSSSVLSLPISVGFPVQTYDGKKFYYKSHRKRCWHGRTGLNINRVFNYRNGCIHDIHLLCSVSKRPNLELKTLPRQLIG
jgi:hypothetical protein